jgi:predicted MFS family arabinose efflux permease
LARIVGPIVAGLLFDHVGYGAPYMVGGVLTIIAVLLVIDTHKRTSLVHVGEHDTDRSDRQRL